MSTRPARPLAATDARIIAFPLRADVRLTQALEKLDAALGAQRAAMEGFRRSLAVLGTQIRGLEHGLVRYRAELGPLRAAVAGLHRRACGLEAIAERASSRSSA